MRYGKMFGMIQKVLGSSSDIQIDSNLSGAVASQIEQWSAMYENKARWLSKDMDSAGIPAAIAGEIARLITLEFKSEITGSTRADYLNTVYKKVLKDIRKFTEYGCAKGGLVFKPYPSEGGLSIQILQADCFFPISFDDSGRISQCVFLEQFRSGKKIYSRLEIHALRNRTLAISNRVFLSTNDFSLGSEISISFVDRWAEIAPEAIIRDVDALPFGYFKVPLANTIDSGSPLGVSVYSRAVDLVREADRRYTQINWEYEAKEAAVHIAESLLKYDAESGKHEYPGGKERIYRKVEYNSGATDKPLLDSYSPEIRDESMYNGYNKQLRMIEFACGLAYGTLSDPSTTDKTAEEIKMSKQRSYQLVADCQMAMEQALKDVVAAIDFYCDIYQLAPSGNYEITFEWDDSILIDAEKERQQDRTDVAMGAMQLWEYRAKWRGETEEQAKAMIPQQPEVID